MDSEWQLMADVCSCSIVAHPAGVPGCESYDVRALITKAQSLFMRKECMRVDILTGPEGIAFVRKLIEGGRNG
jgi:hypothetical protein